MYSVQVGLGQCFLSSNCPVCSLAEYGRPRLGCRVLVYRNFSKILPAILRDIADWTVNSRIKSSQLLSTLLYHLEEDATHHIQALLSGLYRASQDEEPSVIEQVVRSCELVGFYVPPEVWSHLVLPAVRVSAGCHVTDSSQKGSVSSVPVGPVQCGGSLMVLSALTRGAKRDSIQQHLLVSDTASAIDSALPLSAHQTLLLVTHTHIHTQRLSPSVLPNLK